VNGPLAEILRYNRWANLRLFEACRGMTDEQMAWRLPAASGSVGELLTHIAGGQQTFVLRTMGRQHEGEYNRSSPWPGFEPVFAALTRSNDELVNIAEGLHADRDVDLPWMGKMYRFPVSFFLVHAAEHGTTHRTEVTVTLNHFGVETPDLDAWSYAPEAGFGQEVPPG
jgi:uncharacterized damage-inducible protein DinB